TRGDLVAQDAHRFRRRAHEDDAGAHARLGEVRTLGEKAVARMNGVDPRAARHPDDGVYVEIGVDRGALGADEVALVRDEARAPAPARRREDAARALIELPRGAHPADGDLAAVGDEPAADPRSHAVLPTPGPAAS